MKYIIFLITVFFLSSGLTSGQSTKARFGILLKNGDQHTRIKSNDRAKVNDKFKIVIQALNDSYNYVLYSDGTETLLLNSKKQSKLKTNDRLILPGKSDYYEFDDQNSNAFLYVINSKKPVKEIDNLFASGNSVSSTKWKAVEDKIIKSIKSDLNDNSDQPISIAGNVRSLEDDKLDKLLQTFSDKKMIFKKYQIEIKK